MYTEQITQRIALAAAAAPQQLTTTTTLTTGKLDLEMARRALFLFETGAFGGTSPTLSAVLQVQESADGSTWTNNATIPSATVTGQNQQATLEIRAGQLGAGKRYVRLQAACTVGGTSPTVPVAAVAWSDEGIHKPNSLNNDASVVSQTVVN
jgi:hypothetical protein